MPCCAAAKATEDAAESAVAPAHTNTSINPEPVRAEISPPTIAPPKNAAMIAPTSRERSSLERETGASSSQKPSAADASTGPNNRLTASATAIVAANAAQGKIARADKQVALVHWATVRCAFKITLTTIAPIMTAAKTAT